MVRKRLDRDMWTSIQEKLYRQCDMADDNFVGVVSLITMIEVNPISTWNFPDKSIDVTNEGYRWLQLMPKGEAYVVTMIMNDKNQVELWYIDMVAGTGRDKDGVAYFDDLYLDLVLRLDGSIIVDDIDELVEAYNKGDISKEEYQLALDTKEELETGCLSDVETFKALCLSCLERIEGEHDLAINKRLKI